MFELNEISFFLYFDVLFKKKKNRYVGRNFWPTLYIYIYLCIEIKVDSIREFRAFIGNLRMEKYREPKQRVKIYKI